MNVQNIKYRQLKAFSVVVETGSFSIAAERMAVTQPSLSALIKELESDIGIALFERTTRRCNLTSAGRAFYDDMLGALTHLESAYLHVKEIGKGTRGTLNLAALPSLAAGVATQALAELRQLHPAVRIQLTEGSNNEVLSAVRQGLAEIGLGSMWQPEEELEFHELFRDQLMFVAPVGHASLKLRPSFDLAEKFDLILMSAGPTQHALDTKQIGRPPAFQVEHLATALAMVRNGLGICILPSSALDVMNMEGLVCRNVEDTLATRQLGMIARRGHKPSPLATLLTSLLRQFVASLKSGETTQRRSQKATT